MIADDRQVAIFPIGAAQLPRVRTLAYEIWPEAYAGILPADRIPGMLAEIYDLATLTADIAARDHRYWFATVDGRDAGFVSAYIDEGRVWIKKLYVLGAIRGLGLGKRLMATAVAAFPDASSVGLYVNDGNAPAIGFYEAQGFAVEKRVPVRMGPYDFTDFVMARALE
jgi:ribosomal protein S18 acetylase RimI-like enzyme